MIVRYDNLKDWTPMKSQQRTFVVEFKSPRRRSKTPPASIWGNTDLDALVRDAEADAPHLFEPISTTPGQDSELQLHTRPEAHIDNTAETNDGQISALSVEAEQIPPQQANDLTFSGVPQSVPGVRSTAAQVEAHVDELVALEQENRRLKGLLVKHLLQQNVQLREMLARFGV